MTYEKNTVSTLKNIPCETKEQAVEADIVLPEYYPEISKILKLSVEPGEESVTVTDGKFSVAGCAQISLIYCDGDNKPVCFVTQTKYTRIISCPGLRPEDYVNVRQNVVSVNYKAVGPKKTDVRAVIAVSADVRTIEQKEYVSSLNGKAECIRLQKKHLEPVCAVCKTLIVSENVGELHPEGKNAKPIRSSCAVSFSEKKCIRNKLMLKGTAKTETVYITEDGQVRKLELAIPFTEVVDVYGLEEDTVCLVNVLNACADVRLTENGTENVKADVTVKLKLSVFGFCEKNVDMISDCYSVDTDLENVFGELRLIENAEPVLEEMDCSFEAELYDDSGSDELLCAFYDNVSYSVTGKPGALSVCGSLTLNALLRAKDGSFTMLVRSASFEHAVTGDAETENVFPASSVNAAVRGNRIVFTGGLHLLSVRYAQEQCAFLASVGDEEKSCRHSGDNIVLYYAEKGERIWDIAKNNRVRVASVRNNNELQGETLEESRLLIFSDF